MASSNVLTILKGTKMNKRKCKELEVKSENQESSSNERAAERNDHHIHRTQELAFNKTNEPAFISDWLESTTKQELLTVKYGTHVGWWITVCNGTQRKVEEQINKPVNSW